MERQDKVLFIVYRLEWWGCFDSLCRQESGRENVTCYVMPIPRYQRDIVTGQIDREKKCLDKEGVRDELPTNAVLADFETFSLEQKFDRIYIHNPYDNTGAVDAIDEKYYSWNLKKYTDKLIYVPHWIYLGGIDQELACCSVYKHVDAIYLWDDRARYSLDVMYDSKVEIVTLGIPQYLERLKAQRFAPRINNKKRLLYCVSFQDLFYGTERQIRKMWDVFKYMETRADIEFVFRPDEDIYARYRELHGNILVKYGELLDYFKEKNIGILDQSLNPYIAAVEADGIMTVAHPMSSLFSLQGKYTLFVDRESRLIPTNEDNSISSIWAATVLEKENELEVWFVPESTRLICRMVIPEGQVEIITEVPGESAEESFIDIVKVGECLFLIPFHSNGIWKYDLKEQKYQKLYLGDTYECCMIRGVQYNEKIYFIPYGYPGIVKYTVADEKIQIIDGWVSQLEKYVNPEYEKEGYFTWAVKQEENMLYMASSKCDVWLELDLDTDEWKLEKMNLSVNGFSDMVKDDEEVWLLPRRGKEIVYWNKSTKVGRVIYETKGLGARDIPYAFLHDLGSEMVAFPHTAENVLVIPKHREGNLKEIVDKIPCRQGDYLSDYLKQKDKATYQVVKGLSNGHIFVYEYCDGAFLILDKELRVVKKVSCRLPLNMMRGQVHTLLRRIQCKSQFAGYLREVPSLTAMIDYFVECEQADRELIRAHYRKGECISDFG